MSFSNRTERESRWLVKSVHFLKSSYWRQQRRKTRCSSPCCFFSTIPTGCLSAGRLAKDALHPALHDAHTTPSQSYGEELLHLPPHFPKRAARQTRRIPVAGFFCGFGSSTPPPPPPHTRGETARQEGNNHKGENNKKLETLIKHRPHTPPLPLRSHEVLHAHTHTHHHMPHPDDPQPSHAPRDAPGTTKIAWRCCFTDRLLPHTKR
jgi:hypothetical protein